MNRTAGIALALILVLVVGCASGPKQGSRAPAFDSMNADGVAISSASFQSKTVVYYFWATWCAPCVVSGPEIQSIHEKYADDDNVRVVGVHYDYRGDVFGYATLHGYTFELIPDGSSMVAAFGVKKIPQVVVVGPDGDVVFSQIGFRKGDAAVVVAAVETQRR